MSDIAERLRALSRHEHDDATIGDEAADEIERLRAEVARLKRADDEATALAIRCSELRAEVEALREAGRDYLKARYYECRAQASLETARDNFSDGGEREKAAWVAAALKASAAEKVLGALVFDDPPVRDAALGKDGK